MLIIRDKEYLEKVKEYAKRNDILKRLEDKLKYLENYSDHEIRCTLFKTFEKYSFEFNMEMKKDGVWKPWFNGGLIFWPGDKNWTINT